MRHFINLTDSYQDDSNKIDAKSLEDNINLDFSGFEKENKQLSSEYIVDDKEIQKAIKHYTHASSINDELIRANGNIDKLPTDFRTEYNLLMKLEGNLQENHHVYSGTGTFNPLDVVVDNVFNTPAFLSTSLSIKVAVKTDNFRRKDSDEDHIIHLFLPKGFTGGFYIAPYSYDPEELEFLIFPNEKFRHIGDQKLELDGVHRIIHSFKPV